MTASVDGLGLLTADIAYGQLLRIKVYEVTDDDRVRRLSA